MSNHLRRKRKPPYGQYFVLVLICLWMLSMTVAVAYLCVEASGRDEEGVVVTEESEEPPNLPDESEESAVEEPPAVDKHSTSEVSSVASEVKPGYRDEVAEHIETTFSLSDEERYIVEQVVMSECGNEPYEGIVAVAQCIYNTAVYKDMSPAEVVQVPGQYAPMSSIAANENVKLAVSQVFDEEEFYVEEPIMFFYAPKYSAGTWHESSPNLEYACTIGGHKFFMLKGYEA